MTIYFYTVGDKFGEFSNFSQHGFVIDDKYWKTSEHYFQAMKFEGTKYEDRVREARNPKEAAKLGGGVISLYEKIGKRLKMM